MDQPERPGTPWGWVVFAVVAAVIFGLCCGTAIPLGVMSQRMDLMGAFPRTGAAATATVVPTIVVPSVVPTQNPDPTLVPSQNAPTYTYPLAGEVYQGFAEGVSNSLYNSTWTPSGWLWQPTLPEASKLVWHAVSGSIVPGLYEFNGVKCKLFLDPEQEGLGARGELVASYGNSLDFKVPVSTKPTSWFTAECDGGPVSGYSIQWLGPLP